MKKEKEVEIEEIKNEIDYKDLYVRLLADFDNYKKRTAKEKEEIKKNTKIETLSSVLELDNDLHLAFKLIKDENALSAVKIITDKLNSFLKNNNIEEIQTEIYNQDEHEVVSIVETGNHSIFDVVSKGYKMNGNIIKYPKIILSK